VFFFVPLWIPRYLDKSHGMLEDGVEAYTHALLRFIHSSVRPSIRPSVHPSIHPSIHPSYDSVLARSESIGLCGYKKSTIASKTVIYEKRGMTGFWNVALQFQLTYLWW